MNELREILIEENVFTPAGTITRHSTIKSKKAKKRSSVFPSSKIPKRNVLYEIFIRELSVCDLLTQSSKTTDTHFTSGFDTDSLSHDWDVVSRAYSEICVLCCNHEAPCEINKWNLRSLCLN